MNTLPYELHATIKQHQKDLLRAAEHDRLLTSPPWRGRGPIAASLQHFLARTGRWLIAVGTRLETRYTLPAAQNGHS